MSLPLVVITVFCLGSALFAVTRRNLIHAALLLIGNWLGIAGFYLWAGAEFVAFAQVLVYVGAVSMIVLFAVLMTRRLGSSPDALPASTVTKGIAGVMTAATVGLLLVGSIMRTPLPLYREETPVLTVKSIGQVLGEQHLLAVLLMGVLLTVALIGAVIMASVDKPSEEDRT